MNGSIKTIGVSFKKSETGAKLTTNELEVTLPPFTVVVLELK